MRPRTPLLLLLLISSTALSAQVSRDTIASHLYRCFWASDICDLTWTITEKDQSHSVFTLTTADSVVLGPYALFPGHCSLTGSIPDYTDSLESFLLSYQLDRYLARQEHSLKVEHQFRIFSIDDSGLLYAALDCDRGICAGSSVRDSSNHYLIQSKIEPFYSKISISQQKFTRFMGKLRARKPWTVKVHGNYMFICEQGKDGSPIIQRLEYSRKARIDLSRFIERSLRL